MAFGVLQFNLGIIVRDIGLADSVTGGQSLSPLHPIAGKLFFGLMGDPSIIASFIGWLMPATWCLGLVIIADSLQPHRRHRSCRDLGGGILPLMGLMWLPPGRLLWAGYGFWRADNHGGRRRADHRGLGLRSFGSYDYALVA